jgi:hypothetical protein
MILTARGGYGHGVPVEAGLRPVRAGSCLIGTFPFFPLVIRLERMTSASRTCDNCLMFPHAALAKRPYRRDLLLSEDQNLAMPHGSAG